MNTPTKKFVLVVDDEEIIRNFLSDVLGEDFEVIVSSDGDEAIEQIRRSKFDLIITDLKMPRVSGEEVVKYVREHELDAKVIVISGFSSLYTVSQSINSGACAFLAKPFSIRELMQTVMEAING